ncbi:MAG: hypothetical protein U1F16_07975 [Turneriella sp.]
MESPAPKESTQRPEDDLADMIADSWLEIDKKSAAEQSDETRKNEQLILEWAEKLGALLKGITK